MNTYILNERARILIVDDEPFNLDYLEQELEDLHCETLTAVHGQDALTQMQTLPYPDLILLDIMMPQMDGFEVLIRLKANEYWQNIPVVIISALDDMQSVVKGIKMGAEDFLTKPFDPTLLKARIRASLEKKWLHDREKHYLQKIEAEKKRVDELLHVILPSQIVAELKATNKVAPRHYENVAMLFTDIVGFTTYCDTHSPTEVVSNLQQLVEAYERLALNYQLQKIKTIGDAFMAAGGLLQPLENPVLNCVQCGLEMIKMAVQFPVKWHTRVGIHIGSVVAGVIGHRQYLFDVWGDTVNTAQRIESYGAANHVNLSKEAWQYIENQYPGRWSEPINMKGKGVRSIFQITSNATETHS